VPQQYNDNENIEYISSHREVIRSIRKDMENLAKHAGEATTQGNMKELNNTIKNFLARYQLTSKTIKGKEVKAFTSAEKKLKRWVEHLSDLLNRPINCNRPTKKRYKTSNLV